MKIIFCIPGKSFSGNFFKSWTALIQKLPSMGIEWDLIGGYSALVHYARLKCVDIVLTTYYDYDYIMWIDSDMVFQVQDFEKILTHDVDIVSGLYLRKDSPWDDGNKQTYACVGIGAAKITKKEVNAYLQFGPMYNANYSFITEDCPYGLIQVWTNGMGWMLVKKGVFESIDNRWNNPFLSESLIDNKLNINNEFIADNEVIYRNAAIVEDASFQQNALELGFKSYVDPLIRVGHEKSLIM